MRLLIYGLMGHAGKVEMLLEDLEVEDLEVGREFEYEGSIYEIRSVFQSEGEVSLNVVLAASLGAVNQN